MTIHPTALVEEGAELGEGCLIHPYAIIKRRSVLGPGVVVHSFAVIGDNPQHLKFDVATGTGVRIGAGTEIREHVTVHRSTRPDQSTEVGDACTLMVSSHVAHDCRLGNHVVLANAALLAGHVQVGDHAFVGGGAVIHQFCRLGESAIIGGGARISRDVPPFTMATERDGVIGLNRVGLRARGFNTSAVRELKEAYRAVYFTPGNIRAQARRALEADGFREPAARQFLAFFAEGSRGFARPRRGAVEEPD